ncbi:hypothetical protein G5C60_32010 [Streptomyces sp. HC44]|uniref:Uncharacterized protein n=1 Tax=Streptomyces scabichelini TaxID=2711217 RepID=A0A6G4VE76_9ACTN|nr:hypothetical protein [Streptomyces scabichelini]NGO12107.1 hypothetical protein [Streptomyces scabichelini]
MADHEGNARADALLAAITDEPLPQEALDDPEFMAEHRSAAADVAALREQLRIMGDTLATESEQPERSASPAPAPLKASRPPKPLKASKPPKPLKPSRPRRARRYAGVALGALVLAAGTAMLGGLVWLGANSGSDDAGGSDDSAAQAQSDAKEGYSPGMHIACSKVLVEGTVRSITPGDDGNVRVVLDVKRYYRPERSVTEHPTMTVTLLAGAREDLKVGTYTLVRVPVYPQDRQDWETGPGVGDARKDILKALPGARGLKCTGPQQQSGG